MAHSMGAMTASSMVERRLQDEVAQVVQHVLVPGGALWLAAAQADSGPSLPRRLQADSGPTRAL